MSYTVGDLVRLTAAFTTTDTKAAVDPSAVTFHARKPSGVIVSPLASRDSAGVYHADVNIDVAGIWHWRAQGTGTAQAAKETVFEVLESAF